MDVPTSVLNLVDPDRYANVQWRKLPPGVAKPLTGALKAEFDAFERRSEQLKADYDAQTAANREFFNPKSESNAMFMTNAATLPEAELQPRIEYITNLIQSGEAEKYSFQSGNGDETTTSVHQYLYWLQQRARDLESHGTYSPEMFK